MRKEQVICEVFIKSAYEMVAAEQPFSERKIAEKAGYTIRTLYHHFGSMDGLLWIVRSRITSEFAAYLSGASEGNDSSESFDSGETLKRSFHRYLDFFLENPPFYRFLYFCSLDLEHKKGEAYHERDEFEYEKAAAFPVGGGDDSIISSTLILAVQGLLTIMISGNENIDEESARGMLDEMLNKFLKKEETI